MILMDWIIKARIGNIIDIKIYSRSTGYLYCTNDITKIDNKDVVIEAITLPDSYFYPIKN